MKYIIGKDNEIAHALAVLACEAIDLKYAWVVEIKRHVKKRSNPQNNLYWKWIAIVCKETGNDKNDVHEFLMRKFLPPTVREVFGEQVEHYTTTNLNTVDMGEYMTRMQAFFASDWGIALPIPEEMHLR